MNGISKRQLSLQMAFPAGASILNDACFEIRAWLLGDQEKQ
jgi:hypothetical protein